MKNIKIRIENEENKYYENLNNVTKLKTHFLNRIEKHMNLFQSGHVTVNEFDKMYRESMEQLELINNIVL